jgi:hypothetical protein
MEMGFGGPVWHASVSHRGRFPVDDELRAMRAESLLKGVGDARLGQWSESSPTAFHLRRRLSVAEAEGFALRDIRLTPEARQRFDALPVQVRQIIPPELLAEEVAL